jgi:hypothetical protein
MARYSDLVQAIMRETPEAPSALLESEARQAVIEFCRRSRSWTDYEDILTQPGVAEYRLRPIDGGRVDQVIRARFSNDLGYHQELTKVNRRLFMGAADSGSPTLFAERPDHIHIYPYPVNAGSLSLHVVLVPMQTSTAFPDHLFERWREALVAGAAARLLSYSNKPWTNEGKGQLFQRQFDLAVRDARQNAASDQWTPQSIQLRRWV